MKFEIDDKTGMIFDVSENPHSWYGNDSANPSQLEQILQAVKKTQEKIVNKQIQEIQDSKNLKSNVVISHTGRTNELQAKIKEIHGIIEDSEGNTKTFDGTNLTNIELVFKSTNEILRSMGWPVEKMNQKELEKIEENQKIVDEIKSIIDENIHYAGLISEESFKELTKTDHQTRFILEKIVRDATGKDIKDL